MKNIKLNILKTRYWFFLLATVLVFASCEKDELGSDPYNAKADSAFKLSEANADCSVTLLAGQNIPVGEVQVINDGSYLHVTYVITNSDWTITEIHLAVSTDSPGTGEWLSNRWQNKPGNPRPGQFPYHLSDGTLDNDSWTIAIPLSEVGPDGLQSGEQVCIGAHAVVVKDNGTHQQSETAWGEGNRFVDRGNWATYFCCTPQDTKPVIIFGATTRADTDERALYEIDITNQVETKIFDVPQPSGDIFTPNGLAYDEDNDRLYYAMGNRLWFYNRTTGENVFAGSIRGTSYGAVFAGGKYWYVQNGTSNLYALGFDADGVIVSGKDEAFEANFADVNLDFGDIAYDPSQNVIYGSTTRGTAVFFEYDLNKPAGERYTALGTNRTGLQLALTHDGSLYGHRTTTNEFVYVNKNEDVTPVLLFESIYSYNDLAPGPK